MNTDTETKKFNCEHCEGYFNAGKDNCKSCGFDLNSFNEPEDEDELIDDDDFKCDRCKKIYDQEHYISLDNDITGNTICEWCIDEYIKERGLEEEDLRSCDCCLEEQYKDGKIMRYENMVEQDNQEWWCEDCEKDKKPKEEPIKTMKVGKNKLMYYTGDETDIMNIRVIRFELIKKQKPNEPCACGSGKKHKKCCNAI